MSVTQVQFEQLLKDKTLELYDTYADITDDQLRVQLVSYVLNHPGMLGYLENIRLAKKLVEVHLDYKA